MTSLYNPINRHGGFLPRERSLMMTRGILLLSVWIMLSVPAAFAQTTILPNGDFEAGNLTGWTASGINGGAAYIVEEGSCFSHNDTQSLTVSGKFAANIRSSWLA